MAPASSLVSPGVRLSCLGRLGKPDGGAETRKRDQDFHWRRWINRLYFDFHSCFSFPPPPPEEWRRGGGRGVAVPDNYPAVLSTLCLHGSPTHQHKASFFILFFNFFFSPPPPRLRLNEKFGIDAMQIPVPNSEKITDSASKPLFLTRVSD